MANLNELLAATLNEARFDVKYPGSIGGDKFRVSPARLREIYFRREEQAVRRRVQAHTPEAPMTPWVDALRLALEPFIDPETEEIGHAFPTELSNTVRLTGRTDGLYDMDCKSSLRDFASGLVQAAAIMGVEQTVCLLADWQRGERIRVYVSTVLNNLPLNAPVYPLDGIQIIPLAVTTTQLPRLPVRPGVPLSHFLGLTLLKLQLSASPALFRPNQEQGEQIVRLQSVDGITLDLACKGLSVQANRHVAHSVHWRDYLDVGPFCLDIRSPQRADHMTPMRWKTLEHDEGGGVTIAPADDVSYQSLDQDQLRDTMEALRRADKKLGIAIDRWRRSKRPDAKPEDAYIDLRIALESLYLKDFVNEHSGEMRFRLSLMGAWHLSADLAERQSIRKILRDAYDTASKAVHLGEVPDDARVNLAAAQDVCRRGILKLLGDGPPRDWGDLVLGADGSYP